VSQTLPLSEPARSVCTDLLVRIKCPVCVRHVRNTSTLPPSSVFSARWAVCDLLWAEFPLHALQDVLQSINPQHLILTCRRHLFGVGQVQPNTTTQLWAAFAVSVLTRHVVALRVKQKNWAPLISCEWGHMWPCKGALSTPIFSSVGGEKRATLQLVSAGTAGP